MDAFWRQWNEDVTQDDSTKENVQIFHPLLRSCYMLNYGWSQGKTVVFCDTMLHRSWVGIQCKEKKWVTNSHEVQIFLEPSYVSKILSYNLLRKISVNYDYSLRVRCNFIFLRPHKKHTHTSVHNETQKVVVFSQEVELSVWFKTVPFVNLDSFTFA